MPDRVLFPSWTCPLFPPFGEDQDYERVLSKEGDRSGFDFFSGLSSGWYPVPNYRASRGQEIDSELISSCVFSRCTDGTMSNPFAMTPLRKI